MPTDASGEASATEREDEAAEPSAKRAKTEAKADIDIDAELADLFGEDIEESGLAKVLEEAEAALSDAESVPSFLVEEPQHRDEAADFGISQEKLDLVMDIFGDTSVLKPIGEAESEPVEESMPAAVHAGLAAAEAAATAAATAASASSVPAASSREEGEAKVLPVLPLMDSFDPDVLEKSYQLPKDQVYAASQQPERWLQTYCSTGSAESRSWTDEEYQNEARWLFIQLFNAKGYDRTQTEDAIILILTHLHEYKLEMLYIAEHVWWRVSKVLTKEDLWGIQDFDLQWQPLWARYLYLQKWVDNVEKSNVNQLMPDYIKSKTLREVWMADDAEAQQRDAQEWLHAMHPSDAPSAGKQYGRNTTSIDAIMEMARQSKFDEKLGVVESIEVMSLQQFGITPAQLGDNLHADKQSHHPDEDQDKQVSYDEICERHTDTNFHNIQAVKEGIATFLVRLIASEPRVRRFVRKEFWAHCAVSAKVTEAGKALAKECSHSFKKLYRAFHIKYRPVSEFGEKSLFLEMLHLQRKGMISIEYDLVCLSDQDKDQKISVVDPCLAKAAKGPLKMRFQVHCKSRSAQLPPDDPQELAEFNRLEELIPKLDAAAKLREAQSRRRSSRDDLKSQVTASFLCAGMSLDGDVLAEFLAFDPIFEKLCLMYCVTIEEGQDASQTVLDSSWNTVRRNILARVLKDELYPLIWAEVQDHLSKKSCEVVCCDIRDRLRKMLDVQPALDTDAKLDEAEEKVNQMRQDSDDEAEVKRRREDPAWQKERQARKRGLLSAMIFLPQGGETCIAGFVNAFGEPVDMRQIFKSCLRGGKPEVEHEKGSYAYEKQQKVNEHRDEVIRMISTHKPAVVLLAVADPDILRLKVNVEDLLNREQRVLAHLKVLPKIKYVNTIMPRVIAYHKRVMESPAYRDYVTPAHRIAISCARFFQDPLAEACQLWHELPDENGLLKVDLHHLQHDVPREQLGRVITQTLQEVFAKCGLYVNKVRRSPHMEGLIQFVPGLGPRKARLFMKALTDSVKSRAAVADIIAKQLGLEDPANNPVIKNMYPFIKIQPDFRDGWFESEKEVCSGVDRMRIPPMLHNWVEALCREALSPGDDGEDDAAGNVVVRVMELLQSDANFVNIVQDRDWSRWHEQAGEMNVSDSANLDKLFETILEELQEPFKDNRQIEEEEISINDLFYLALTERAEAFAAGSIVRGTVSRDEEYPDREVVTDGSKPMHRVFVKLAGGTSVSGAFHKEYRANKENTKTGHIPGCNRHFVHGEPILARVREITAGRVTFNVRLSVDQDEVLWYELYPVQADDLPYFLPAKHDDWTKVPLGLMDNSEMQKKAKLKDWVRRPRNIKHPNYVVGDHMHAVHTLHSFLLGTVLFRSSKHHDMLIAMLKVLPTQDQEVASGAGGTVEADRCYRRFDVFEKLETKSYGEGFEVAGELEVDGYLYRDFDEIIARHMDPIMDNLRLLQEHKRFGLCSGTVVDRTSVERAMMRISADNTLLHYSLLLHEEQPGHGALHWCVSGKTVKQELIEVTPRGFGLWNNNFDSLDQLISWFKRIGWRNSQKLRRDYKEDRKIKVQVLKEKRGEHADPEGKLKRHKGLGSVQTTTSGMQTPGNRSVSSYRPESNAATPYGMRSPASVGSMAPGSLGSAAPGSSGSAPASVASRGPMSPGVSPFVFGANPPTPLLANPPTPSMVRGTSAYSPGTPTALLQGGSAGSRPVPSSAGSVVPVTPAALRPGSPGGFVPQTPAAAFPSSAAGTPSGAIPQTPVAAFAARGTPSGAIPETPTGAYRPSGGTPSGAIPETPTAAFRAGGTPSGAIPQTPLGAFQNPAGTPSGANIPATPTACFQNPGASGSIPTTPVAAAGAGAHGFIPQTPTAAFTAAGARGCPSPGSRVPTTPVPSQQPGVKKDEEE